MLSYIRKQLHNLKGWVESFAEKPHALWALFGIAFVESALIPIPPDVLLIALGVAAPRRAILYGLVTALGGFLGGYVGYYIGYSSFELLGRPVLTAIGVMGKFDSVLQQYHEHGVFALTISGFTPLPYIAFTLAAGFNKTLSLATLTIGSAAGRFLRFGLVGILLYLFGPPVKLFIDRYFERISVAVAGLLILFIFIAKFLL